MIRQRLLALGALQKHRHLAVVNVRIVRLLVLVEPALLGLLDRRQNRLEQSLGQDLLVRGRSATMTGSERIRRLELQLVGAVLTGDGDRQTLRLLRRNKLETADSAVQSRKV